MAPPPLHPLGAGACFHGGVLGDGSVLNEGATVPSAALRRDGVELADVPAARAAQLLYRLPPSAELLRHLREGLHSTWSREQRLSCATLACAAPDDGPRTHFSCAPAQQAELDAFFMATDVVRLSHLRRLRDSMPRVAAALHDAGI